MRRHSVSENTSPNAGFLFVDHDLSSKAWTWDSARQLAIIIEKREGRDQIQKIDAAL